MKNAPRINPPDNIKNKMSPVKGPPLPLKSQLMAATVKIYAAGMCHVIYFFNKRYAAPTSNARTQPSPIHPDLLPMNISQFETSLNRPDPPCLKSPRGVALVSASTFHLGFFHVVM